jgi:peptide chain release factor 1
MADGMDDRLREIEARYEDLERQLSSPDVAQDTNRLRRLGKDYAELGEIVVPWREYRAALRQAEEARTMAKAEPDADMAAYFRDEADTASERADRVRHKLEELLVPKDPNDDKDVVLEIRAGPGGQEAMLWAGDLFELYRRYAERRGYKTEVLSASPSDLGGFKEVVVEVRGKGAYSRLKHESGTHRVQRVPVTESSGRIHTSTATVAVLPEAEEVEVDVRPEDLVIDVYRSSGPGGQSVNTTDSAVRITHKPTGIVVGSQEERSQLQNREKAMRYLRARLFQKAQEEQHAKEAAARKLQVGTGDRAEKIRTYNFPDNRVTDHRVKLTMHQMQDVLDGDIDQFVDALLASERGAQLAGDDGDVPPGRDREPDEGEGDGGGDADDAAGDGAGGGRRKR